MNAAAPLPSKSHLHSAPDRQKNGTAATSSLLRSFLSTAGLLACALSLGPDSAQGAPRQAPPPSERTWRWEPTLTPRALLIEGLWTEAFQLEPAMHTAGLPYSITYISRSPYFNPYSRFFHMPAPENWQRFSLVVLGNIDAPTLGKERLTLIQDFVREGGGLLVLGGYWAFGRGAYQDSVLSEILPVTFSAEASLPRQTDGLPLRAAPGSDWNAPLDFQGDPRAFFVHSLQPKEGARVQVLAGDIPAVVTGSYGKGRVVACALTVNGTAPEGKLAFWDWPGCRQLVAHAADWAASNRPSAADTLQSKRPAELSEEEKNSLALGGALSAEAARRLAAQPTRETAQILLSAALQTDGKPKVSLSEIHRALLPFAQPSWGAQLRAGLEKLGADEPSLHAALALLGASRDPASEAVLEDAFLKDSTRNAAMEGLGLFGSAKALPEIRRVLARAETACKLHASPAQALQPADEDAQPYLFPLVHGATIVEANIALYRLGDPAAVQRLLETHRYSRLLLRIFNNARKRRVPETDLQGLGILKRLHEAAENLEKLSERLAEAAGPVPQNQVEHFTRLAATATDPEDVAWLSSGLERSPSALPQDSLTVISRAKDGILARGARALQTGR